MLTPVVDWLATQPGVDAGRLVLFGRSFAGDLAPRGATAEHRIAALVCYLVQYDFAAAARSLLGHDLWAQVEADDPAVDAVLDGAAGRPAAG